MIPEMEQTATGVTALDTVLAEMPMIIDRLTKLSEQLDRKADELLGGQPSAVPLVADDAPHPPGKLGELRHKVDRLEASVSIAESAARRLMEV